MPRLCVRSCVRFESLLIAFSCGINRVIKQTKQSVCCLLFIKRSEPIGTDVAAKNTYAKYVC